MHSDPTHAALADALRTLRLGIDPSDLHGSLTGYLCAGGRVEAGAWPAALELDVDAAVAAGNPVLQQFQRGCHAQFAQARAQIEPLLPATDTPLPVRAEALVEWCRGFLGGFGLGGAAPRLPLSAEAREILADFGTIAASHFEHADAADDAAAFADVLDFVRTAATLLHRDVRDAARAAARVLH